MSFTPTEIPFSFIKLGGGLNNTSGPFNVAENESPDLQNIAFDKTGSIMPRNGYTCLNTTALTNTVYSVGLYWYRTPTVEKAIRVFNDRVYRMDSLDGTWDDITQTGPKLSTAAEYLCDFTTFNSKVLLTNDANVPQQWIASGSMSNMTVVSGLTQARFVTNFQNYCLMANCVVSGVDAPTRVYWSAFKNEASWDAADYIEVGYNDGQEITGLKVLGDRLIVYKTKSIWFMPFTGDADVPFLVFKTNSPVGCVAPFSIQDTNNGHIFLSYDGLWWTDGTNGYKLSDKVSNSIREINRDRIAYAKSAYQYDKNRYWLSVASATSTSNNLVFTYDTSIQAFSKYTGISASSLSIFSVGGLDERLYFDDYIGHTYRADSGVNDNPSNTALAVNSYYYTDWKNFNDICDSKGIPHVYIYHSNTTGTLTFAYDYDFHIPYITGGFDDYTKLLVHFDGSDGGTTHIAETGQTTTFVGTAQLDTAQKKFGTASLLLDGNSDYVTLPYSADWNFGTGDFTIDCWIRFNSTTGAQGICGQYQNASNYLLFYKDVNHKLNFLSALSDSATGNYIMSSAWSEIAADTWYHIAFVRTTTTAKLFINGVSQTLTETTAFGTNNLGDISVVLNIGTDGSGSYFNGWIDEFRISKGIARWTTNFTPPTVIYDNSVSNSYTQTFSMATTQTVSDLGVRRDLTGRGRVVRFKFANFATSTAYLIHGIGVQANLQSKT